MVNCCVQSIWRDDTRERQGEGWGEWGEVKNASLLKDLNISVALFNCTPPDENYNVRTYADFKPQKICSP